MPLNHIVASHCGSYTHTFSPTHRTEAPPVSHQSPAVADTAGAAVAGSAGSVGSAAVAAVDSAAGD